MSPSVAFVITDTRWTLWYIVRLKRITFELILVV